MTIDQAILNVSVFGSYGRGNPDDFSDLDILVVCRDGAGTQNEHVVRALVASEFDQAPSISWYGHRKLSLFFETGDLFAWHLFSESYPLAGYKSIAEEFGTPKPYKDGLSDIYGLQNILGSIPDNVARSPQNLVYELGLVYVCLRNIAMTASSKLCKKVDFSRNSPFNLPDIGAPVSEEIYDNLAGCRHASTRGTPPPVLDIDKTAILRDSISWAQSVERMVS